MDITELANKHSEDINIQQSLSSQIPNDYNTEEDEDKKIISDKEQSKPQVAESVCPPQGRFNKCITNGFLLFMIWFAISSVSSHGRYPNENSFGLLFVFCCSLIAGKLLQVCRIPSMPPLPPLLGMLLAGFTIRNAPYISEHVHISSDWSSTIRNIALTLILIKAGLGLDIQFCSRCCLSCCCCPFHAKITRRWIWY
uniref:Solute carrier family 9 member B1 n=1 Tax=Pipistrellus kuhlii TaxID=59472 RepID=A0A7J8B5P0_PIPKU|nr:solute carrier family 9 member B1 [Pipistrellus kuhlii]